MAKGNDKKVVRQTHAALVAAISNLLISHRERTLNASRADFCAKFNLVESTVGHIETGRFLKLKFTTFRRYLAAIYGRNDPRFVTSARVVYDGLKGMERLLKKL